jgi:hypothetical protein
MTMCTLTLHVSYTMALLTKISLERLRWSRGCVLAFSTQVCGFKPGRSHRIFQGEKILSTTSFGREVKPLVPCRRFTARKRSLNVTWKSGISGKIYRPFLAHIVPPLAARISMRRLVVKVGTSKIRLIYIVPPLADRISETTSGESWNV